MNNNISHHPFHGFNNNINNMQRFREEPQLRLGTLSHPSFHAPLWAYASSGFVQPVMQSSYHQEGARRPALNEAFAGTGIGNLSPALRQAGTAQPLQDSRPRIFDGRGLLCSQSPAGHLHATLQTDVQRRQLEENMDFMSLLWNVSSHGAGADPPPQNHAQGVANGGREHGSIFARGDGVPFLMLPAPYNKSGSERQRQPELVDYMSVQGVRVALGDVKSMAGSSRETSSDVWAEANTPMNLDLALYLADPIDLTLKL